MSSKTLLRTVRPHVTLHRCPRTGLAWVEDRTTGTATSAHPNISATGSVRGMKDRGYWQRDAATLRTRGFIYNVSVTAPESTDDDRLALAECRCPGVHAGR